MGLLIKFPFTSRKVLVRALVLFLSYFLLSRWSSISRKLWTFLDSTCTSINPVSNIQCPWTRLLLQLLSYHSPIPIPLHFRLLCGKNSSWPVAQLVGAPSCSRKVVVSMLTLMFLSLSLPFSLPLSKSNEKVSSDEDKKEKKRKSLLTSHENQTLHLHITICASRVCTWAERAASHFLCSV